MTLRSATPKRENPSLAHSGRGPRAAARPGGGAAGHAAHKPGSAPHFPLGSRWSRLARVPRGTLVAHFLSVRKTYVSKELQIIYRVRCAEYVPRLKEIPGKAQREMKAAPCGRGRDPLLAGAGPHAAASLRTRGSARRARAPQAAAPRGGERPTRSRGERGRDAAGRRREPQGSAAEARAAGNSQDNVSRKKGTRGTKEAADNLLFFFNLNIFKDK